LSILIFVYFRLKIFICSIGLPEKAFSGRIGLMGGGASGVRGGSVGEKSKYLNCSIGGGM
jgi:hypothetical protein